MTDTIRRREDDTAPEPMVAGLLALGWILSDDRRAERLLSLTGLTPEQLRTQADDPHMLAEVIGFLESHEPDLVSAAESTGVTPAQLLDAKRKLAA